MSQDVSAPLPKPRSCVLCRQRKVRCDKESPCSNCRNANVVCTYPSTDPLPRWARRLDRIERLGPSAIASNDPGIEKVTARLRNLENLVKDFSRELEQAHAAASSVGRAIEYPGSSAQRDPEPPQAETSGSTPSHLLGRLVLQDTTRTRYISSSFWSRIDDELAKLKVETRHLSGHESDASEDDSLPEGSTHVDDRERAGSEYSAFLFRHNWTTSSPDLNEYRPLPSQIPFLLETFSENVNYVIHIVHMPTIRKMVRDMRIHSLTNLSSPEEALMFSLYFGAVASMEEEDVVANFGLTKSDLSLRYRLGMELALAKADFLNSPDLNIVQAFTIFLCLLRRHDNPRYVWMMAGLVIRMARYLGLHRDGSHFPHLTPFEVETRRMVWWAISMLDARAAEDQGTDLTITSDSFDTKFPLNINDTDIQPDTSIVPAERDTVTDMSFSRISAGIVQVHRQLMAPEAGLTIASLDEKSRILSGIYQSFERQYLKYSNETNNIAYWFAVVFARLIMAKLTLVAFLPVLFSSPTQEFTDDIRTKLLFAAIEVAENNHALNAEPRCRHWRWLHQTCTFWHAIVYLAIDISRRDWAPSTERAWVALHSNWLIPARPTSNRTSEFWVPVRRLMHRARKHREAELERLRAHPEVAIRLELNDQQVPIPTLPGPFSKLGMIDIYRKRWRQLVALPESQGSGAQPVEVLRPELADPLAHLLHSTQALPITGNNHGHDETPAEQRHVGVGGPSTASQTNPGVFWAGTEAPSSSSILSSVDTETIDAVMDLDLDVNWDNWIESAQHMEQDEESET
ncbi:fungal-specific transcription factor domain-containing protein [Lophiotrema nucula]|uniref:Fungal-specific transcription factor domain-containing protein n=1 Tax=Lophiotrema nucula TaxID=690887 RepID=A0A6A5ZK35_9PLEO|nr:fungal-specific transcription factor domain-containing protein [Lophiotrema nucula]